MAFILSNCISHPHWSILSKLETQLSPSQAKLTATGYLSCPAVEKLADLSLPVALFC